MNLLTLLPTHLTPPGMFAYALNLLLHLTVICLMALGASHLFFRRDPAMRHALCLTGLVCLLLAPLVVGMETKAGSGLVTLALPSAAFTQGKSSIRSAADKPYRVTISANLPTQPAIDWVGEAVLAAYMLGVGCGALRLAHGCRRANRLKQNIVPWREAAYLPPHIPERALPPAPPVFTSLYVASPIAIGLLHPAIILPEGLAETLSPQQLRHVLLHEYAHIAFRHGLGGLLERIAGVLFWPHPLVRALCRELGRAREEVCDNFASQKDGAICYARTLLTIAQEIAAAPNLVSTLALLGAGTSLEARIAGLLDPRRDRMVSLKRWKRWAAAGTAVFTVASTVAVRIVTEKEPNGSRTVVAHLRKGAFPHVLAIRFPHAALEMTPPTLPRRTRALVQQIPHTIYQRPATDPKKPPRRVIFQAANATRRPQHKTRVSIYKPNSQALLAMDFETPPTETNGTVKFDTFSTSDRVHLTALTQTEPDLDSYPTPVQQDLFVLFRITANGRQDARSDAQTEENGAVDNVPFNSASPQGASSVSVGKISVSVPDTTGQNQNGDDTTGERAEESVGADASQAVQVTLEDMPTQGNEQYKTSRVGLPEKTPTE